jgi:hypothetical protein
MPTLECFSLSGEEGSLPDKIDPEAVEREAFEKGFASGEKAGDEISEQKATVFLDQLEKLFREIYSLK